MSDCNGMLGLAACEPHSSHDHYPFCNTSLPLNERVHDLVGRIHESDKPKLLTARSRASVR